MTILGAVMQGLLIIWYKKYVADMKRMVPFFAFHELLLLSANILLLQIQTRLAPNKTVSYICINIICLIHISPSIVNK